MTYIEFIENIKSSRENKWFKGSERHHIIPVCLGGSDEDSNLIYLTPREHFIAHKLLVEEHPEDPKLIYALWRMSNSRLGATTPNEYQESRERYTELLRGDYNPSKKPEVKEKLSRLKSGVNHHMYGKKHTEETKRKMSESHLRMTEETKERMRKSHTGLKHKPESIEKMRGRVWTEESRTKLSAAHKGKIFTEEHKKHISESAKNRPPITLETRRKMSESHGGFRHTEESKQKMSKALKGIEFSTAHKENLKKAFKNRVYHRICEKCGSEFLARSSKTKYCDDCKKGF